MAKTVGDFTRQKNSRGESEHWHENPNNPEWRNADHYKVVLKKGGKRLTTYYSKGYGHKGKEPTAKEVLHALAIDSSGCDADFHSWASEYGYDPDNKAKRIFKACNKNAGKLLKFLGKQKFDELLSAEED